MTPPLMRLAVAAVRAWTRLYTWRVAPGLREARRAEIESDLWEFQQDSGANDGVPAPLHILARLLLGIPDDVSWRVEQLDNGRRAMRRAIAVAAAATILSALWIVLAAQPAQLPQPPGAPIVWWRADRRPPPPPPPPPPPCPPAGIVPAAQRVDCIP